MAPGVNIDILVDDQLNMVILDSQKVHLYRRKPAAYYH